MGNSNSIFTRRRMGLDSRVWWVMLVACVLSIGLVSYKISGDKPCVNVVVAINGTTRGTGKTFFVGETVRFAALFAEGKKIEWDFGDQSNGENGIRATHTYKKEGKYPITISVDGKCIQHDAVLIKKVTRDSNKANNEAISELFGNPIDGNTSPTVMQSAVFNSNVEASAYEWSISNYSNYPIKNTREAQFVFQTPGLKVVQLKLDNDENKVYKKDIIVQPLPVVNDKSENMAPPQVPVYIPTPIAPGEKSDHKEADKPVDKPVDRPVTTTPAKPADTKPDPGPAKPATIRIGNENFKDLLQDLVNNNVEMSEFDDYLCDKGKTRVLVNDERNWTTFAALCNKIKGDDKVTIEKVEQIIDNNCVVKIKVTYSRKKFLGIIGK